MSVGTVSKQVCDGVTGPSVSWGVGGGERVFPEVPRVPRPALPSPLVIWKLGREGAARGARGAPGALLTSPPHPRTTETGQPHHLPGYTSSEPRAHQDYGNSFLTGSPPVLGRLQVQSME